MALLFPDGPLVLAEVDYFLRAERPAMSAFARAMEIEVPSGEAL